jgi:flavin-dependent dehydrogenase
MNAPDGTEVVLPLPEEGFVLERRVFDYELAKSAANAGGEILTRAYVNGLLFDGDAVSGVKFDYRGEQHEVEADVIIAADGVESRVGRWAGIKHISISGIWSRVFNIPFRELMLIQIPSISILEVMLLLRDIFGYFRRGAIRQTSD